VYVEGKYVSLLASRSIFTNIIIVFLYFIDVADIIIVFFYLVDGGGGSGGGGGGGGGGQLAM